MALNRSARRSCHLRALLKPVTHPHAAHPVATRLLPKPIEWESPVTETYCIMRLHSRQLHSACSPWTRSRSARQQGAEPERRIGRMLKAMVLGRRRVTLFVTCHTTLDSFIAVDNVNQHQRDVQQFNAACALWLRGMLVVMGLTIATLVACFGFAIRFRDAMRAFYTGRFGATAAEILIGLTPFPSILVLFAGLAFLHWRIRTPELNCPNCGRHLLKLRHIVVATKHCPHCGVRILKDVSFPSTPEHQDSHDTPGAGT
jgi:DNA-directed RNA polymerase subunit RPC12/RpoP